MEKYIDEVLEILQILNIILLESFFEASNIFNEKVLKSLNNFFK